MSQDLQLCTFLIQYLDFDEIFSTGEKYFLAMYICIKQVNTKLDKTALHSSEVKINTVHICII